MFALAFPPLLPTVFLILKLKVPIHHSVLIFLVSIVALSAIFWEMSVQNLEAVVGYGALKGLWSTVIVILGVIFSYNVMQMTRTLDILRDILASVSENKRIQVLLISWCFGGFLEAATGYDTAVATPIGILVVLGFNLLKTAVVSLTTNTIPAAFDVVGIPVSILAEQANLSVYTLGGTIILQLVLFDTPLPPVIICIIGGGLKAIRGIFLITLTYDIPTSVLQYLVAIHLGAELPAFAGSLISLSAVVMISRLRKGKTDPEWHIGVSHTHETTPRPVRVLFRVGSTYLSIFMFILSCSPLFPTTKGTASQLASVLHFTPVDSKTMALKVEQVTTPGILTISAAIIGGFTQGAFTREMLEVLIKTTFQLKNSTVAIMAVVVLVMVMDFSGIIFMLVQPIVDLTDSSYVFPAPVIGALGALVTGSDTNSSTLFGKPQTIAASKSRINPNWLAATNTSSTTEGKMVPPQSITIAVPATRMNGQANQIISDTMKYCCAYIAILGLRVGLFYCWFMAQAIVNPVKLAAIVFDDTVIKKVYTTPKTE